MNHILRTLGAAIAVSIATATSLFGSADGIVQENNFYDHQRRDGFVQDGYMGDPCCPTNCCWYGDLAFSAEALVFQACEDGIPFGSSIEIPFVDTTADPSSPRPVFAHVREPHFKWDWGYRLGLYYDLPCDCWGLALLWTHYNTHAKSSDDTSFFPPNGGSPTPTLPATFFIPAWAADRTVGATRTDAHLKLRIDLVDLELGRAFCISDCLTLRPHIGVRAAWIKQSYDITNFFNIFTGEPTTEFEGTLQNVHLSSDYESVGLRGGLDSTWDLGCGFCLYGKAAASILAGHYDMKSEAEFIETFGTSPPTTIEFQPQQPDDFCACRPVLDLALGLCWKHCVCDCLNLTINLGWEHHMFLNHNQFEDFVQLNDRFFDSSDPTTFGDVKNPQLHRGDLCIKGFVFGAKIDF